MSLTSVKPNLIFPECPTTPTPLLRMAGVQRHRGPSLTFTSILPHSTRGLGASGGGARGAQGIPVRTPLWSSLGTGCSHIPGPATVRVPIMSLLELQVQNWKPNENPQKHFTLHCFRCLVNYKHLGRIEIRFSTNQCELNYESFSMSELRKDFFGPWRDAKCMTLKKWFSILNIPQHVLRQVRAHFAYLPGTVEQ